MRIGSVELESRLRLLTTKCNMYTVQTHVRKSDPETNFPASSHRYRGYISHPYTHVAWTAIHLSIGAPAAENLLGVVTIILLLPRWRFVLLLVIF